MVALSQKEMSAEDLWCGPRAGSCPEFPSVKYVCAHVCLCVWVGVHVLMYVPMNVCGCELCTCIQKALPA